MYVFTAHKLTSATVGASYHATAATMITLAVRRLLTHRPMLCHANDPIGRNPLSPRPLRPLPGLTDNETIVIVDVEVVEHDEILVLAQRGDEALHAAGARWVYRVQCARPALRHTQSLVELLQIEQFL